MSYDLVTKFLSPEKIGQSWEDLYAEVQSDRYIEWLTHPLAIVLMVIPMLFISYHLLYSSMKFILPKEQADPDKKGVGQAVSVIGGIAFTLFVLLVFTSALIPYHKLEQYTQIRHFEETQLTNVLQNKTYTILDPTTVNNEFRNLNKGYLDKYKSFVNKDITLKMDNVLLIASNDLPHLALVKVNPIKKDGKTIKDSQRIDYILNIAESE